MPLNEHLPALHDRRENVGKVEGKRRDNKPFAVRERVQAELPLDHFEVLEYARRHGFEGVRLNKLLFATWCARFRIEQGEQAPAYVPAVPLPDDVHPIVRKVYDGFIYLLGCRWTWEYGKPAPYTPEFAATWCGVSTSQAKRARLWLTQNGYLVACGRLTQRGPKQPALWKPGAGEKIAL